MNRILRGAVVFAASALFVGCNTEPEAIEGGVPDHIIANPSRIFVDNGDSTEVLVRLVDQQGTSLPNSITFSSIGAGISLGIDSLFRPVFAPDGSLTANPHSTELRVYVKGTGLTASSFTITAADKTLVVPVVVTPVATTPTVSNAAPQVGEVVTITPEAGLTLSPNSEVLDAATGARAGLTLSVAPDGSSMTVQFLPGFSGVFSVTGIVPSYAPTLLIDLPSTVEVAVAGTIAPGLTGVDAFATAPALRPANPDLHVGIIDNAQTFPATGLHADGGSRLYKLIVEEAAEYSIQLSWPDGKDMGVWVFDEAGTTVLGSDDSGGLGDASETAHVELEPGTYFIEAGYFDYGANPVPEYITIEVFVE